MTTSELFTDIQTGTRVRLRLSQYLMGRHELQTILRHEVCRADRNQGDLTMVIWQVESSRLTHRAKARLSRILLQRIRTTDVVGWFSRTQLCAILPDTAADGAWTLVRDICKQAESLKVIVGCSVHSYAEMARAIEHEDDDDDLPGGNGGGNGSHNNGRKYPHKRASESIPVDVRRVFAETVDAELHGLHHSVGLTHFLARSTPLWKRSMDIIGAGTGLVALSPLIGAVALAIKLTSAGPIIFRQQRAGLGGVPFTIYKFRTMRVDAESHKEKLRQHSHQDGPAFKMRNDPRVTTIGKILRKTSLDELPQLWNVLIGDMSLVGPRPLPLEESMQCARWQSRRLEVAPGLTCIWQVRGRSRVSFAEWIRMDMQYIRRRTPLHDLQLLISTIPAVILRRGAH